MQASHDHSVQAAQVTGDESHGHTASGQLRRWNWILLATGVVALLVCFGNGRAETFTERSLFYFAWQESGGDAMLAVLLLGGAIMAVDCWVPAVDLASRWLFRNRFVVTANGYGQWSRTEDRPSVWGWFGVAAGLTAYVLAWRTSEPSLGWLAAVWTLGSAALATRGWSSTRRMLPALIVLAIGAPVVRGVLEVPLQATTADGAVCLLQLLGVAVEQVGLVLRLPGDARIEIAPVCSGVRTAATLVFLGMSLAHFDLRPKVRSVLGLAVGALVLALAANILRVCSVVLVSHAFGEHTGHRWHEQTWSGLLPVMLGVAGLLWITRRLKAREAKEGASP